MFIFFGKLAGYLYTDKKYGLSFKYDESAERGISISLPLENIVYRRKMVEPFFSGLLPDGEIRDQLAKNAHLSPNNIIGLLSHYGREIAGALVIVDHGENFVVEPDDYILISEREIAERIKRADEENLLIWGDNVRLSLAGAQHKMPLYYKDGDWFLPCGNSPSNCIVKPSRNIAVNEFIVTRLAEKCGFNCPKVELKYFGEEKAFVSYRYDRIIENGRIGRLNQEDMCQALSIPPEKKNENDGGPGIRRIVNLIENNSSMPILDIKEFYRIIVFNFIVGNCDSHGKNYSFLYSREGKLRLAPFYDLVSTTIYPGISRDLSMKVGKQKNIDLVLRDDFLNIEGVSRRAIGAIIDGVVSSYKSAIEEMDVEEEYKPYEDMINKIKEDSLPRIERLRP